MHNLDTLSAVGPRLARPGLKTPPTIDRFTAQVEALLGQHDRHRKPSYTEAATELISHLPEDPYVLAVFMEDSMGYEADAELVELLTGLWPLWLATQEAVTAEWAATRNVTLLPLHTKISATSPDGQAVRGEIVGVLDSTARYRVQSGDAVVLVNHEDVAP